MARGIRIAFLMVFVVPVVLTGCSDLFLFEGEEFLEYDEEIYRRGGVMTGEKGEWVIFQK